MALVLTGASMLIHPYTDSKGAERTVTIRKGVDVETLGLPDSVVEELANMTYSEHPKRYYFSKDGDTETRQGTVRIKASKDEAGVPPTTISMVGMRKELAVSRGEIKEAKKEKIQSIKNDGIVRAWSEPSFDKGDAQGTLAKELADKEKAAADAAAVEAGHVAAEGPQAVVQMDAEVEKAEDVQPVGIEGPEDAPKKEPVKRIPAKKPGPKAGTKKKTTKKTVKKTPKNDA
jgi:hypothetical protein